MLVFRIHCKMSVLVECIFGDGGLVDTMSGQGNKRNGPIGLLFFDKIYQELDGWNHFH